PSASLTEISPSSAKASSAVTIRPGFQTNPVARERCECTETIACLVRATTSARAEENEERTVAVWSVMAGTPGMALIQSGSSDDVRELAWWGGGRPRTCRDSGAR